MLAEMMEIAKKVAGRYKNNKEYEYDDYIQCAMVGILEARKKWEEGHGNNFEAMAYRYALNEINDLLFKETTRNNRFCRVTKSKEVPKGLLFNEGETEDNCYFELYRDEVFLLAEDNLTKNEYIMFVYIYLDGDTKAVKKYMDSKGCSRRTAYRVRDKVREKMSEVLGDVSTNRRR